MHEDSHFDSGIRIAAVDFLYPCAGCAVMNFIVRAAAMPV